MAWNFFSLANLSKLWNFILYGDIYLLDLCLPTTLRSPVCIDTLEGQGDEKNERRQENGQQEMSKDRPTPTKHGVMTWIIIPVLGSWRITLYNLRKTGSKGSKQPAKHHSFELVESCKWKFIQFISQIPSWTFPQMDPPFSATNQQPPGRTFGSPPRHLQLRK